MFRSRAGEASFFFIPAMLLALASCGIETVSIYEAPGFSEDGGLLKLTHDSANDSDPSFSGYEIYYRAYQDSSAADTDRTAIQDYIDLETSTPDSCITKLESLKYKRIRNYQGKDVRPLFSPSTATFNLYYTSGDWYVAEFPSGEQSVTRSIGSSFQSQYETDDEDYSGSEGRTSGGTVHFVVFAVAYGLDVTSSFNEIYSFPAGIGSTIKITLSY
jgi:hypothetical protein